MFANKLVLLSSLLYIVVFIYLAYSHSNTSFNTSDAAGNAMAKGLGLVYGLVILFVIALVLTIINAFYFGEVTSLIIKILFFVPILMPTSVLIMTVMEVGRPTPVSIDKQRHRISFEIRTKRKLSEATLGFRGTYGRSKRAIKFKEEKDGYYYYVSSAYTYHEYNREYFIRSGEIETENNKLDLPYIPVETPLTDWVKVVAQKAVTDSFIFEVRYKITSVERL